jgi:hypothetical protein
MIITTAANGVDTVAAACRDVGLRAVFVDDLGRDALVFSRYQLVLIDADAAEQRPDVIAEFIAASVSTEEQGAAHTNLKEEA